MARLKRVVMVAEAAAELLRARARLATRPFADIARQLGGFSAPAPSEPCADRATAQLARAVGRAIARAAPLLPLPMVCLPRALAAQAMLRRRGIAATLHLGAARNGERALDAHAWLEVGGVPVTGYPVPPDCIEVARIG